MTRTPQWLQVHSKIDLGDLNGCGRVIDSRCFRQLVALRFLDEPPAQRSEAPIGNGDTAIHFIRTQPPG
nr:hypothetical protein CFP56_72391 [Quercus suber]